MPNHRRQDRELDALYASLPKMECRGFCHDSCGPIDMSVRERARIEERAGAITCANQTCSMLTAERRCAVYELRPMVCRLWGLSKRMSCPYGCEPEGGFLSDREAIRAMLEAERIGGSRGPSELNAQQALERLDTMSDEEVTRIAIATLGAGRATVSGRLATLHRMGMRAVMEEPGVQWSPTSMAYPRRKQ